METIKALLPVTAQSSSLSKVKQQFNELEDICEGVFRLNELSKRTQDKIVSFGELLSSLIISNFLQSQAIHNEWLDIRQLIKTNSNFGAAAVDFISTNQLIEEK